MKKYLPGLFALVLAVGFSAFTYKAPKPLTAVKWYDVTYNGTYPNGAIYPGAPDYEGIRDEVAYEVPCNEGPIICVLGFSSNITFPNGGMDPLTDFSAAEDQFTKTP